MSNDYFNLNTVVTRLTAARAAAINAFASAVTAAFDKLPASALLASDRVTYAPATGSANALQLSLPLVAAYTDGMSIRFKPSATNTGPTTLQVNALGARAIRRSTGDDLNPGDLVAGTIHEVAYNGANFELLTAVQSDVAEANAAANLAAARALQATNAASDAAASATAAATSAAGAAGAVGAAIGVTVQGYDADLQGIASTPFFDNEAPIRRGGIWTKFTVSNFANTLLAALDAPAMRAVLGLGAVATDSTVPVTRGGTGGNSQFAGRAGLGLGTAAVLNGEATATLLRLGGTQILVGTFVTNGSGSFTLTFPSAFIATPVIVVAPNATSAIDATFQAQSPTSVSVQTWNSVTGAAAGSVAVNWVAIGPWQ